MTFACERFLLSLFILFIAIGTPQINRLVAVDTPWVSQLSGASDTDAAIVRTVRTCVENMHFLGLKFDDELSSRGFGLFVTRIDPEKSFFLDSDVTEFLSYEKKLDDQIKENSVEFAYLVYHRFLLRLEQVLPRVHQQIDASHDFSVDEWVSVNPKEIRYAKSDLEMVDRWRKKIKLNYLELRLAGKSDRECQETLHHRYRDFYREATQLPADELLEMYLTALTNAMDPHTNYKAPRAQEKFENALKLEMSGIGVSLKQINGATIVDALVPGGAAELDGRIKSGDQLFAIAQEDGSPPVEIQNKGLSEVVPLIRGKTGTRVNLYVKSSETEEPTVYEIERSIIKLDEEAAKSEIVYRGRKPDGTDYAFGYIKLNSFYQDTDGGKKRRENYRSATRDLKAILIRFREFHVDAVILDLSRNDRGMLDEAISATGLFIDRGPIVQVKSTDGTFQVLADEEAGVTWDGPLVVMVSQMSTSASEVFTGAIQDYSRGLVVGDPKTHGKGTVQKIVDIVPDPIHEPSKRCGAVKLSYQKFYRPGGKSTQLVGVESDIVLPSLMAKLNISESDLEYAMPSDSCAALQFQNYGMVNEAIRNQLQRDANLRIEKNEDFQKLQEDIDAYEKQRKDQVVSLNETKYRARHNELTSEKIRERHLGARADIGHVFINDSYNQEVLNIARDYFDRQSH